MKLSVAMATYNGALYLSEQLESIAEQTLRPDELVISDDGSSDRTWEILESFAACAPFPVRLFRNNLARGFCGNFNNALLKTTGDVVFLSDQDDYWFVDKLETTIEVIERDPSYYLYINDVMVTDERLNRLGYSMLGWYRDIGLRVDGDVYFLGCACAVRRELLNIALPIADGYLAHDRWLVRMAIGLNKRRIINEPLQFWRRHGSNTSSFERSRVTSQLVFLVSKFRNHDRNALAHALSGEIFQENIFIRGVDRARFLTNNGSDEKMLLELKNRLLVGLSFIKWRRDIHQMSKVTRGLFVIKALLSGDYRSANGVKSAIADLLSN